MTHQSGAALAEAFHRDVVGPLIGQTTPGLRYAAARLRGTSGAERQWAPYPKWFEAGFAKLGLAQPLGEPLNRAVTAKAWREREDGLVAAIEVLAQAQRECGLPTPEKAVVPFWDRPYRTINDDLVNSLGDWSTGLPLVGSIEQWVDNTDILARPQNRPAVIAAYRAWLTNSSGR